MLDYFGIFTRGGAFLWTLQFTALRHSPVEALNALVRGCLLEERLSETTFTFTPKQGAAQTLKWTFHNVSLKSAPFCFSCQSCTTIRLCLHRSCVYHRVSGSTIVRLQGLGLVFVAVYQKTLSLLYVDELLQRVKAEFAVEYKPHVYSYRCVHLPQPVIPMRVSKHIVPCCPC